MKVPLILGDLPLLVIVQNELIYNGDLFEDNKILGGWIILDISCYSLDLVDKLINLLELDQEDLVSYDTLYQVNELFSLEDIQWNQVDVQLLVW